MSSADRENALAGQLIERLLVDPGFRAEFRRDPAAACLAAGLPELADELAGSAGPMDTLVVRESRSSLAGVVMAVAVEGMSVGEAHALMSHGLTGAPRGLKLPHSSALHNPLGQLGHGHVPGAVRHELRGVHAGSPAHAAGAPAASSAPASTAAPAAGTTPQPASTTPPPPTRSPAPADAPVAAAPTPPEPTAPPARAGVVSAWPDQHAGTPANAPVTAPATPEPAPPNPGAQPVDGGAVPAWPDQQSGGAAPVGGGATGAGAIGAGGAPGGLAALLESPQLSAPPAVRTFLTSGGADPRMVSVLDSALANHTIGLGQVEAVSDPVHVQAIDIVSVDGQPVGPDNLAARDLVTEIAAMDPSVRPNEIGTPWPIQSPGFFSDAGAASRLHLAFEMPGTDSPPAGLTAQAPGAMTAPEPGQVAYSPVVGTVGAAPTPAEVPLTSVAPAPMAAATPGSGVDAALAYAHAMIGKLPESAGSNLGPQLDRFEADFGYHGSPWCGIFAGHVLEAAGLKPPHSVAAVASILDLARNGDPPFLKGVLPVSEARPGDLVTFGGTEHVAVVTKVDAAGVHTIAGNTSQSNVSETTYSPSSVTGVVRPDYASGTPGSIPGVWDYSGAQPPSAAAALAAADTAPSGTTAPPPPTSGGGYVNPLPDTAQIGRTDMGVDADMNPGDPIVAPGTSRVLGITPNWYRGQPYVALQLLDGPMKGHNYFLAEQINLNVSVGQIVQQGQPIAHYAASGTGIEIGWAGPNWQQTLAQATTGYSEGEVTAAGKSFHEFLDGLGHNASAPDVGSPDPDAGAGGPDPDAGAGAPDPDASAGATDPATAVPAPDPSAAAPTPTGPAPFTVLESRHHGPPRHTVQFLPAVQPSPGSPLFGQAPRPPVEVTPSVVQEPSVAASPQPVSGGLIDQVSAAAPTGGSISVNSSLLTPGQAKFAGRLAELTGLDPRVVAAWELAEESGSAAQGREAASNFNWLNIGYFDSGAGKIAFDKEFGDPISAAEQSAKFLKGDWGGASSSIRAILNSVGHSPDEQIAAIANSDWASSHYGGGANLHGTYNELGDIQIEKSGTA
ncbi:MAG TPA: hypothetical protein VFH80_31270 [Solirubrobacteraceae bacterium]|nr:hypothetical protein [Solirubrobacteraceae bacterium]